MTDFEIREMEEKFIADVKDIDSGNVDISDGDVDDREGIKLLKFYRCRYYRS